MADAMKVKMGTCEVYFGSVNLGYTSGSVKVKYSIDTVDKMVDQADTAIDQIVTRQAFEVEVPLAEYNLAKLVQFIPGAVLIGDDETDPVRMKLIMTGMSGTSMQSMQQKLEIIPKSGILNDKVTVYHAIPNPNIDFAYEKDKIRVYNVTFKAIQMNNNFVALGDTTLTSTDPDAVVVAGNADIPTGWYDEPANAAAISAINGTPSLSSGAITTENEITFTATVTGSPYYYLWNFGDGSVSEAQAPTHTYATADTYVVTLYVTNASGGAYKSRSVVITEP